MYLQKLMAILKANGIPEPYACIVDVVQNGVCLDRFTADDLRTNRNNMTIFLAAWCRHVGLTPDVYSDWLLDYSVDILSRISSSKPSHIRHNTKSIIKYIHRSDVPFVCNCQHNVFKAVCSPGCPVYPEMESVYLHNIEMKRQRREEFERQNAIDHPPPDPETLPVTKRNKKQFEEAIALIEKSLKEGMKKKEIAVLLNESGFVTMYGKVWTPTIVSTVCDRHGLVFIRRNQQKVKSSREQLALYRQQQDDVGALIVQCFSEGKTADEICLQLNEKGYRTVTGCFWKVQNVIRIAKNYGWKGNPVK